MAGVAGERWNVILSESVRDTPHLALDFLSPILLPGARRFRVGLKSRQGGQAGVISAEI
jgi:hypothetical protein